MNASLVAPYTSTVLSLIDQVKRTFKFPILRINSSPLFELYLDIGLFFVGGISLVKDKSDWLLSEFTTYYASKPPSVPWTSMNTLFAVWLGVNDVGNSWWLTGEDTTIGLILDDFFEQCQIMYDAGGRYFLFLTVPRELTHYLFITEYNSKASHSEESPCPRRHRSKPKRRRCSHCYLQRRPRHQGGSIQV